MSGGDGYKSTAWAKGKPPLALSKQEIVSTLARLEKHLSTTTATRAKGLSEINKLVKSEKISAKNVAQQSVEATFVLRALYGYDSYNRRIFRATDTSEGVRWHTWDGWQLAEEWEETEGPAFTARKAFFDGLGIDEHLGYATHDGQSWTRHTIVQDCLGNVMQVCDSTGGVSERYEYDPYGRRTVYQYQSSQWVEIGGTAVGNAYGYTGRQHDPETGLAYLRNRYLDPSIGRFPTNTGDWTDSGNWGNGYAFVGNSANSLDDALGLRPPGAGGPIGLGGEPPTAPWDGLITTYPPPEAAPGTGGGSEAMQGGQGGEEGKDKKREKDQERRRRRADTFCRGCDSIAQCLARAKMLQRIMNSMYHQLRLDALQNQSSGAVTDAYVSFGGGLVGALRALTAGNSAPVTVQIGSRQIEFSSAEMAQYVLGFLEQQALANPVTNQSTREVTGY